MEMEQFSVEEREEIVRYGLERGKIAITSLVIALIMGGVFGIFYQSIIFLIVFCSLRRYAGGYHADSQRTCYVISFVAVAVLFLSMKYLDYGMTTSFLLETICFIAVVILSPVDNKNKILGENERILYARKTRIIAIVVYALSCFLYLKQNILVTPILTAYLLVTISLLAGYIKNRFECNALSI